MARKPCAAASIGSRMGVFLKERNESVGPAGLDRFFGRRHDGGINLATVGSRYGAGGGYGQMGLQKMPAQ